MEEDTEGKGRTRKTWYCQLFGSQFSHLDNGKIAYLIVANFFN